LDYNKPRVIFSYNDISGIQLGPVVSKTGFSLEEIEANCTLWCNGHLHNGQALTPKVINLGNLTGKDFGEDASKYSHNVAILDTKTLDITYIENPYAYNFYKIQIDTESDINQLYSLKNNAVVSVKCEQHLMEEVKQRIVAIDNIIESRLIMTKQYTEAAEEATEIDLTVDHLSKFIECCKAAIENSTILDEELSEICK
jgi:DNA repair exonuclease SbcCD nuclease subunit